MSNSERATEQDVHILPGYPDPELEDATVSEKLDGLEYRDGTWYVTFDFQGESSAVLEFTYCEFRVPDEMAPEGHEDVALVAEELREIPNGILDHITEQGYEIVGYEAEDDDGADPENWLYDGECPDCGDVLLIERVGKPDVCYDCGMEASST